MCIICRATLKGQLTVTNWIDGLILNRDYKANEAVDAVLGAFKPTILLRANPRLPLDQGLHRVRALLALAKVPLSGKAVFIFYFLFFFVTMLSKMKFRMYFTRFKA